MDISVKAIHLESDNTCMLVPLTQTINSIIGSYTGGSFKAQWGGGGVLSWTLNE